MLRNMVGFVRVVFVCVLVLEVGVLVVTCWGWDLWAQDLEGAVHDISESADKGAAGAWDGFVLEICPLCIVLGMAYRCS